MIGCPLRVVPPLVKGQPPLIVIKVVTLIIDPVRLVVKVVTSIIGKVKKNSKSRGSPQRCLWRVIAHPFRGMVGVCNNLWKPPPREVGASGGMVGVCNNPPEVPPEVWSGCAITLRRYGWGVQ